MGTHADECKVARIAEVREQLRKVIKGIQYFQIVSCLRYFSIKRLRDFIIATAFQHQLIGKAIPSNYKKVQIAVAEKRKRSPIMKYSAFCSLLEKVRKTE